MSRTIILPDTDTLAKLGKTGQLDLLLAGGNDIYITSTVLDEVSIGSTYPTAVGTQNALNWINQNISGRIIVDRTTFVYSGPGRGEESIVDYVENKKSAGSSDIYVIVTDNIKDTVRPTSPLFGRSDVFLTAEYVSSLVYDGDLSIIDGLVSLGQMYAGASFALAREPFRAYPLGEVIIKDKDGNVLGMAAINPLGTSTVTPLGGAPVEVLLTDKFYIEDGTVFIEHTSIIPGKKSDVIIQDYRDPQGNTLFAHYDPTDGSTKKTIVVAKADQQFYSNDMKIAVGQSGNISVIGDNNALDVTGINTFNSIQGRNSTVTGDDASNLVNVNGNGSSVGVNGSISIGLFGSNQAAVFHDTGNRITVYDGFTGQSITSNNATVSLGGNTSANIFGSGNNINLKANSGINVGVFGHGHIITGVNGTNGINIGGLGSSATVYGADGIGSYVGLVDSQQVLRLGDRGFTVLTAPNLRDLDIYGDRANITFAANTAGNVHGQDTNLYLQGDSNSYAGFFGTGTVSGIRGSTTLNLGGDGTRVTAYGEHGVGGYVGLVGSGQSLTLGNWGFSVATAPNVRDLDIYGDHANITFAANTTGHIHGTDTNLHLQGNSNSYAGVFGKVTVDGVNGNTSINVGGEGSNVTAYGAENIGGYVGLVASRQTLTLGHWGFTVATAPNLRDLDIYGDRADINFAANTSGNVHGSNTNLHLQNNSNSYAGFFGTGSVTGIGGSTSINVGGDGSSVNVAGSGYVGLVGNNQSLTLTDSGSSVATGSNLTGLTIFANQTTFNFANTVSAKVIGNGNVISVSDNSNISIEGGGNDIKVYGSGSSISVGGNGQFAADEDLNHLYFTSGGTVNQFANSRLELTGSNLDLSLANNTMTYLIGGNNDVSMGDNNAFNYRGAGNYFNGYPSYDGWNGGYNLYSGGSWANHSPGNLPPPDGDFGSWDLVDPKTGGSVYYDPIVISLDKKAISSISVEMSSAFFDVHNDGKLFKTGWGTAGSGYLVDTSTGKAAVISNKDIIHTFRQLESYDSNGDKILDGSDTKWDDIKIWVDTAGDASFTGDALVGLDEMKISSINLSPEYNWRYDNGNIIVSESTFIWADGTAGDIAQVDFRYLPDAETMEKILSSPIINPFEFSEFSKSRPIANNVASDRVDPTEFVFYASSTGVQSAELNTLDLGQKFDSLLFV